MANQAPRSYVCSVLDCHDQHKSLQILPTKTSLSNKWMYFINEGRDVPLTERDRPIYVCAHHFSTDCFLNLGLYNAGSVNCLFIDPGSVPTIRLSTVRLKYRFRFDYDYFVSVRSQIEKAITNRTGRRFFIELDEQTSSSQHENTHGPSSSSPLILKAEDEDHDKSSSQHEDYSQCSSTPFVLKIEDFDKDKVFVQDQRPRDGCQTDHKRRSVGTQLSGNTLVHRRSRASQVLAAEFSATANVCINTPAHWKSSVSVAVGTPPKWKRVVIQSSTTFRPPFKPSKRRGMKPDDDHGVSTDPCIPGESVSTESTLSQASPSINNVPKYMVDEVCLLQLFEDCPACGYTCEVQKTTRGTLLTVHQLCLQCDFSRNWRSQQLEEVPSGDPRSCTDGPESSAAAAITEIIGFSDENDSSDEGSSEADQGEHNSDSDWDPVEHHNIDEQLGDSKSDADSYSDSEKQRKVCRELCPECGKTFNSLSQKAHICENKKPYSCLLCGKRFLSEGHLKAHSKIHEDGYEHVCKYCWSTFKTRSDKLVHEQSHQHAEKPYQCPDCPQVFAKMLQRRDHLVSHRGPTRHICHTCNMEFPNKSALERHMAVHTKAKQFVCEVCQRSFTQPSHLKSHMRVHTGEKPYQCQHCDKSFNHNVSLKSHIQRYHGQVPDPGMKVQMEKKSSNESEAEKYDTNEMDSSSVDAEEAEQTMDTLCNAENGGDEEEEKKEDKCTKKSKYYRPTGRHRGRPKTNVDEEAEMESSGVDAEEAEMYETENSGVDADEEKRVKVRKRNDRPRWVTNENEKDQGNSDSTNEEQEHDSDTIFEPGKRKRTKKGTGRPRGRPKNKQCQ